VFHWVMAAAMFVLLFTAFLPVVGIKFAWVTWHWIAGLVLTGSILFHVVHATFFLDFWSIWVGPKDIPELKAELLRELGQDPPGPKPGKYPLGNRLYHLAILVVGFAAVITGPGRRTGWPPCARAGAGGIAVIGPAGMSAVRAVSSACVRDASAWPTRRSSSSLVSRPCTNAAWRVPTTCSRSACEARR